MPRLVGINHVAVEVGGIEEALEFFGRIFELELRGRGRRMAFIDMGDQFLALSEERNQPSDEARHFGLVVDDKPGARATLEAQGVEILAGPRLDFLDPWGNRIQAVDYRDVQFTKAPPILRGMGMARLRKRAGAIEQLRAKGFGSPSTPI